MTESEDIPTQTPSSRAGRAWRQLVAYAQFQWLRCLLLILFGVGVHVPALQGPLLWDDLYLARDNPFIKSPLLIPEAFRHYLFPSSFAGHYRPVQTISYVFDYLIWNTDPYGYHLSNLFWHIGSGILLYLLLQRLLQVILLRTSNEKKGAAPDQRGVSLSVAAFFIALLWVVHPVHSAAVDYVSGRADSLAFFFACGGWLLYLRAREVTRNVIRRSCYFLAALSWLLALGSRETGFVWMMVFLLYLFIFDRKPTLKAKLIVLACCFAVAGAYGTLRSLPEYRRPPESQTTTTAAVKSSLMLRALGDYGRLMIWPVNLHMERDVTNPDGLQDSTHWRQFIRVEYLSIAGLLVMATLLFGASRKGTVRPIRILGAGWFLIAYLPISNLFELNATVAEHWLYLPSVGFLIFVAGCCLELPLAGRRIAVGLACAAVLGLGARSFVRSTDWVSAETFYQRTLRAGGSSVRMCVNLATIYSKRGESARAESILRKVIKVDPTYLVARNNLAALLSERGEKTEAKELFDSASRPTAVEQANYPRTWTARLNLAGLAHGQKDDQSALAIVDQALRDYPGTWELARYKTELLRTTRGPETALPIMEEFTRGHWWHCEAFIALGRLSWEHGDPIGAEKAFRHASWLDVHDAEALSALALLRVQQNRLEDAFKTQSRAVARQPDEVRPYLLLSDILQRMGRTAEANAAISQVTRMKAVANASTALN
ncbi:MAG TPA: tetratricopeptide repeat protein [Chthoniobacterales bacterium]|nr:tetratricopeptide repeat protein [Chthoniobacterales bacterium]